MNSSVAVQAIKRSRTGTTPSLVAFLHVRNEEARIPHVLDHHRRLGIQEFFVVDNMSTDRTRDILGSADDVNLFLSSSGYADTGFGMKVLNPLLDEHGSGKWCLVVDADEHFVYPHCENKSLRSFTRYLDKHGFDSVLALMVDMYGDGSIQDTRLRPDARLVDVCRYFDGTAYYKKTSGLFPFVEVRGGPRMRAFWDKADGFHPPTISKVPLVKWSAGMRYVSSTHYMTPAPKRLANVTGALLHFKYLSDFHDRARIEAGRQQHFAGAREYKRYLDRLESDPALSLFHAGSVRYDRSSDLVRAGLCATTNEWGMFI